ncbi:MULTISPECIES: hypothetical protein [unclassified Shewanella]|uniref:hypothetical protein n=1 Tax=unclassified Shewanella TaxID=196818 RepID=UPI0021DA2A08|nr:MULTISPECIES: hypothetical protein [unclassified Shewanella]MCU8036426.1 hypothetical protein [Shewanella sp. SM71]MCU8098373.1 hypothetical protein [Shewanella sp. SM102]
MLNMTKICMIALIASLSCELTLWIAAGMTLGMWYLPPAIFLICAVISDRLGFGSLSDFLEV